MRKRAAEPPQAPAPKKKVRKKKTPPRQIRWDKLDNTAHLFPVIAGEQTSNVYRISVTLTALVDPKLLQKALDLVLPKFDSFNLRMRRGVFWHYFEENGKPAPKVRQEAEYPCRYIYPNRNRSYLFQVSYYKYRINLEVFHVLTDGMGAMAFLKELTYQYLRLAEPALGEQIRDALRSDTTMNREDSFLKNYRHAAKPAYQMKKAYLIRGERLRHGEFGVMHGYIPIPELKAVCKRYDVTINEYLVGIFAWSVYQECLHGAGSKDPIRVAVPVNLRPYFKSITTKNFFAVVSAEFHPTEGGYDFAQVLAIVRDSLRSQLNTEHLEHIFSYNVSNQKNYFLRLVPLPLKSFAMRYVYTRSALANTTTISNIGRQDVVDIYRPYIAQFHAMLALSKGQHLKGTICSYGDLLTFSFTYDLVDTSVQCCFFRRLTEDGLQVEVESNGVNYG